MALVDLFYSGKYNFTFEVQFFCRGHKFEQIMTTDRRNLGDLEKPVNDFDAFNAIIHFKIGNLGFLSISEIDGVDERLSAKGAVAPQNYVEIKTCREPGNLAPSSFADIKMLKWWIQCFLTGVPKLLVGFRDNQGIIRCHKRIFHGRSS